MSPAFCCGEPFAVAPRRFFELNSLHQKDPGQVQGTPSTTKTMAGPDQPVDQPRHQAVLRPFPRVPNMALYPMPTLSSSTPLEIMPVPIG